MMYATEYHGRASNSDCPACGYKKALAVTIKDGRQLFHCHAGCAQADLLATMRGTVLHREPVRAITSSKDNTSIRQYAQRLWDSSAAADGTIVELYLHRREIHARPPSCLRFIPCHPHKPSGKSFPVMLAAVTDCAGKLQAVHRTYLARDGVGKAPVEPTKMTLGAVGGFACHFAPAGATLAVAEGIETGLSVQQATGIPTWAALSAGGVRSLILPPLPLAAEITICADNDGNGCGQNAAYDAAQRWVGEGRRVRIALPPVGQDFNDVILAGVAS